MSGNKLKLALLAALGLQVAILAGVFINGFYPLWLGQEVRLQTQPLDPRDLFRGNYARLNYEFNNRPLGDFQPGQVVYLPLTQQGELWQAGQLQATPPQGLFLRGRVGDALWGRRGVKYGIDALFAPKEEALRLEKELRHSAVAVVRVAPNGKAALVRVEPAG